MPEREGPPKGEANEMDAFKRLGAKLLKVPREEVLKAEKREKPNEPAAS